MGIIQTITVRKINDDKYEIISGERRYRASKIANLDSIPCYIKEVENDTDLLKMSLVENVQRVDLDPIEISLTYQRLINEYNLNIDVISRLVGKDRSTISNYVRLLKLDPIIQSGIINGIKSDRIKDKLRDVTLKIEKYPFVENKINEQVVLI